MKATIRHAIVERNGQRFHQYKAWVDEIYAPTRGVIKMPCAEVYRATFLNIEKTAVRVDIIQNLWLAFADEFGDDWANPTHFVDCASAARPWSEGTSGMSIPENSKWFEINEKSTPIYTLMA